MILFNQVGVFSILSNCYLNMNGPTDVFHKIVWQKRTFFGFCTAYFFVFLDPLQIFVPNVEIISFINQYF